MVELVQLNGVSPCYIRPIALRGFGQLGVNPLESPIEVYIANYEWGRYLGHGADEGVDVCVSSWNRLAPNTMPVMSKAGANYMNSQLIKMEALLNGYVEGIALNVNGYVSEGSGENLFVVFIRVRFTLRRWATRCCRASPATRWSRLAREMAVPVVEQMIPRELLYIADEVFFTGTAAEITPIRSVDKILVAKGATGPMTKALQREFFNIVNGVVPDRLPLADAGARSGARRLSAGLGLPGQTAGEIGAGRWEIGSSGHRNTPVSNRTSQIARSPMSRSPDQEACVPADYLVPLLRSSWAA